MAVGSSGRLNIRDYTSETSAFELPSYQIDAANFATWLTGWGDFKTATDAIIVGVIADEMVRLYDTDISGAVPTSAFAQREIKLLIRFASDANPADVFRRSLPTPDLENLTFAPGVNGFSDFIELADGGIMAAWVAAFEAVGRNPNDDTDTVTVVSAQVIGVNN